MTESASEVPRPKEVTALILAAGEGERLGGPKAFLEACGTTLLERAVDVLAPFATRVLVGLRAADVSRGRELVGDRCEALAGGATRQATFARLLARAKGELVLVHDVARPFAAPPLIERVLVAAREFGAAAPAVSASAGDSMALAEGEWLGDPLPRERVLRTQTPQAFRRGALVEAMKAAADQGWEETSAGELREFLEERYRESPYVITSDEALVGVDFTGEPYSAVIDSRWIQALPGGMVKLVLWYDNEWGYSSRVLDLARAVGR